MAHARPPASRHGRATGPGRAARSRRINRPPRARRRRRARACSSSTRPKALRAARAWRRDDRGAPDAQAAHASNTSASVPGSRCAVGSSSSTSGVSRRKARATRDALRLAAGQAEATLAHRRVEALRAGRRRIPSRARRAAAASTAASSASGRAKRDVLADRAAEDEGALPDIGGQPAQFRRLAAASRRGR